MSNWCDFDHETAAEVRWLPIGTQSHIAVCHEHYLKQLDSWFEAWGPDGLDSVPCWNALKRVDED